MNLRWFAIAMVLFTCSAFCRAQSTTAPASRTAVITLRGQIDDFERDALMRRYREARAAGAKTIILEIDTYGGLVTSGLDISRFIKQQSDLRTIAFVHDKAISAGAMIALACDEIVMQPSATIGDCAPISYRSDGSLEALPPAERAKAESPILADFRDSAIRNGHDPTLVESMVAVDRVVYVLEDPKGGDRKFVDEPTYKELTAAGWNPLPSIANPIDRADGLLTLNATDAAKVGLSRGIFSTTEDLAGARRTQHRRAIRPRRRRDVRRNACLADRTHAADHDLRRELEDRAFESRTRRAEAVSVISLGLLIGMPLLTGYATWWEVGLIFVGLALLALEIFVLPGHFVAGAIGVLMIVVGLIMTFVGAEPANPNAPGWLPGMQGTWVAIQRGLYWVTAGLVCSLLLWTWLNRYLPKLPYFNKLVLSPAGGDPTMMGALGADVVWPLVGAPGRAVTALMPGGTAEFLDASVNDARQISVISETGYIGAGASLVVTESRGNRVVVKQVN